MGRALESIDADGHTPADAESSTVQQIMTERPEPREHPPTFEVLDESGTGLLSGDSLLSERERRLVIGAANFHALASPGHTFRFTILRGPEGSLPSLTDRNVAGIEWQPGRDVVGSLVFRSLVHTTATTSELAGLVDLTIDLGGPGEATNAYYQLPGLVGKARRFVRFTIPVQFDVFRQYRTDMVEKQYRSREIPRQGGVLLNRGAAALERGRTPAILFGLHWLELGGAERWALETVQMAKDLGFVPIVIADRPSTHPWITRPELDDAVIVPLTQPVLRERDAAFLNGILSSYDVRGVHVHHCTWLYERLPWIKSVHPEIPTVDSLHILEWRTGGFVDVSVRMSSVIDVHHVISPQLRDYLIGRQNIAAEKVSLATLARLTTQETVPETTKRTRSGPFTVAYVGRFAQQKRPYLFLKLAAAFKSAPDVRFIMHGEGELIEEVRGLRNKLGLSKKVELRGADQPVSRTLAETDALVITSENEGLTLTTFEATTAGIPVISTDVGSQASLVANELLCPRHTYPFMRQAAQRIRTMIASPEQGQKWLDEQKTKATAFAGLLDARQWTRDLYQGWLP